MEIFQKKLKFLESEIPRGSCGLTLPLSGGPFAVRLLQRVVERMSGELPVRPISPGGFMKTESEQKKKAVRAIAAQPDGRVGSRTVLGMLIPTNGQSSPIARRNISSKQAAATV